MTLYTALKTVSLAAAPMIPFMTEDIYQNIVRTCDASAETSIHLCSFPEVNENWIDAELEAAMDEVRAVVTLGRAARNGSNIKNRQPLGTMYVKADAALGEDYVSIVEEELNIRNVVFVQDAGDLMSYNFKPQMRTLGPKYGKKLGAIRNALAGLNGSAAKQELDANGVLKLDIGDEVIELAAEDLLIEAVQKEGLFSVSDNGVTVALDTTLTEELIEEGFVREMVSKIQTMRKDAGFEVMDHITVTMQGSEKLQAILEKNKAAMAEDVLADAITCAAPAGYTAEWNINGEMATFGVEKVQ